MDIFVIFDNFFPPYLAIVLSVLVHMGQFPVTKSLTWQMLEINFFPNTSIEHCNKM